MGTNMFKNLLCVIMLLFSAGSAAGNDIWVALFNETLQNARQGDSEAQYNVGAMYQNGRGVTPDRDKAAEWYDKAAKQGNTSAVSRLGLMEANQASFSSELQQAEQGNAESQYNIGNMLTKGVGTNMDPGQALVWYEKAAGQGHIKAAYKLGLAHYEGSGVGKNGRQALKWLSIAADDGYAPAQYYLGKIHAEGNGVRRNYSKALDWFTRAVDGGFDQARGEMIDVTERMEMQAAGNKPAQQEDRIAKAQDVKKGAAAEAKPANTPAAASVATTVETMESLMLGNWSRDEQAVAWLPSTINNCRTEQGRIVCFSDDQVRKSGSNTIKFKTKTIISDFSNAGAFNVTYRNLVISAVADEAAAGNGVSAFDEAATDKGYAVKTGWGTEHTLECQLNDRHALNCTKNKTHAMVITNQQQVADRK
jgi:TPR repeat protein